MGSSIELDRGYATKYADFATLSFHPVKTITTGEGGAILTNLKKFDKPIKLLRQHAMQRKSNQHWNYSVSTLGYNFRLPDMNCALGLSQIKKLDKFVAKRVKIAKVYNNFFTDKKKFITPTLVKNTKNSFHLYPLLINFNKIKKTKTEVIKEFLNNKIRVQVHYIPVNTQPYYKNKYGFDKKKFKNSLFFFNKTISLPIYYELSKKNLEYIKKVCKKIFKLQ